MIKTFAIFVIFFTNFAIKEIKSDLRLEEELVDDLTQTLFPLGKRVDEDMDNSKKLCERFDNKHFEDLINKYAPKLLEGLSLEMARAVLPVLSNKNYPSCALLEKGDIEGASKMVKEYNSYEKDALKVTNGFQKVLVEAAKPDSKVKFPQLICYIKRFHEKILSIYPDNSSSKLLIEVPLNAFFPKLISILEEKKGKAAEDCQLAEEPSNPSEFKSAVFQLYQTVKIMDK